MLFNDPTYNPYSRIEELKEELAKANILMLELLEKLSPEQKESYALKVFNMIDDTQEKIFQTNSQLYS